MDINQITQDEYMQAHDTIMGIHKRAFFGRLRQFGIVPQGPSQPAIEKEASALLQLGFDLTEMELSPGATKVASDNYGDGPFAMAKKALDTYRGNLMPGFEDLGKEAAAPGFENMAPPAPYQHDPAIVDAAHKIAVALARNPAIYKAACVVKTVLSAHMAQASA